MKKKYPNSMWGLACELDDNGIEPSKWPTRIMWAVIVTVIILLALSQ